MEEPDRSADNAAQGQAAPAPEAAEHPVSPDEATMVPVEPSHPEIERREIVADTANAEARPSESMVKIKAAEEVTLVFENSDTFLARLSFSAKLGPKRSMIPEFCGQAILFGRSLIADQPVGNMPPETAGGKPHPITGDGVINLLKDRKALDEAELENVKAAEVVVFIEGHRTVRGMALP